MNIEGMLRDNYITEKVKSEPVEIADYEVMIFDINYCFRNYYCFKNPRNATESNPLPPLMKKFVYQLEDEQECVLGDNHHFITLFSSQEEIITRFPRRVSDVLFSVGGKYLIIAEDRKTFYSVKSGLEEGVLEGQAKNLGVCKDQETTLIEYVDSGTRQLSWCKLSLEERPKYESVEIIESILSYWRQNDMSEDTETCLFGEILKIDAYSGDMLDLLGNVVEKIAEKNYLKFLIMVEGVFSQNSHQRVSQYRYDTMIELCDSPSKTSTKYAFYTSFLKILDKEGIHHLKDVLPPDHPHLK